jgi:nickel-dependent lactate racemase
MDVLSAGSPETSLSEDQMRQIVAGAAQRMEPAGKKVLVVIPDHTRTCPLPTMARAIRDEIGARAAQLDYLIALGTHPPLTDAMIDKLLALEGKDPVQAVGGRVFNHAWKDPDALARIGKLTKKQIDEITGGLFAMDIDVTVNKMIFDYDQVLICGPVFPHEVVGFSGGAKYFFPGICGQELLDFFHWLGAVITNPRIIGNKMTPVRKTLHAALDLVDVESYALCMVGKGLDLNGLFFGRVKDAWSAAADLSDQVHTIYVDKPYSSVLSRAPEMYDELWVGGKCMYKMESVVADGGELIIYAPHITEISATHGKIIEEIGYHTRDYFLGQWERFQHYPWGVVAHSTHVRGIGSWKDGVETCRVNVTLATGIPEETCKRINLGYRDPASIDIAAWQDREHEGRLYVPKAGEMLYKLRNAPHWARST